MILLKIVGITTSLIKSEVADSLSMDKAYFDSVKKAGGLPVGIPIIKNTKVAEEIASFIDILVLSGGVDIRPFLYGKNPTTVEDYNPERDDFELALLEAAMKRELPILAICRGMQLTNIHLGGSLIRDLKQEGYNQVIHHRTEFPDNGPTDVYHFIETKDGSVVNELLGKKLVVNSLHHQAIDSLGDGVVPVAYSEDGVIEAIELVNYPNYLGFQFHPERLEGDPFPKVFEYMIGRVR